MSKTYRALRLAFLLGVCVSCYKSTSETPTPTQKVPEKTFYEVKAKTATITVSLQAEEFALSRESILHWVERAALSVEHYYGRFPVSKAHVKITAVNGNRVSHGTANAYNGPEVRISLGRQSEEIVLQNDWKMTHEMVHLAFPSVPRKHHWIEEGLATYVEPFARRGIGELSDRIVWKDFVEGLPNGLPKANDKGLDNTPTWGRTYWGGALFCLVADVEIHRRTNNQKGLRDALRAIVEAGGSMEKQWSIQKAFAIGDQAIGVPVLTELYESMKDKSVNTNLQELWEQLGVVYQNGTISFNETAPLSGIRKSISVPTLLSEEK